jgi:hypothetical protein
MSTPGVISKRDAELQGLARYNTGQPCAQGHSAERYTSSAMCVQCVRERQQRAAVIAAAKKHLKEPC